MPYKTFIVKKEVLIKNYTEIAIWNVTEYDEDKGQITLFLFDNKEERDTFLKEDD